MPIIDFSENWSIVSKETDHPVIQLAVLELQEHLSQIIGREFLLETKCLPGVSSLLLTWDDGSGDGFSWGATDDRIEFHGNSPRALLYAVYDFLEHLGCRWAAPGFSSIPRLQNGFVLPDFLVESAPALNGRCLILGHHAYLAQAEDWLVWAGRNRINTIFFHVTTDSLALGAAPERQYQRLKPQIIKLTQQRGMVVEHGGHGLAALLPRKLFKKIPGAFRFANGKRTPDHNFCPFGPDAMTVVRKNAEDYFRAHLEVNVFHLWADDIPGGGWCECEHCQNYSPSEQAMLAVNQVAEVLEQVKPGATLSYLAYYDTEGLPERIKPRNNVCLLWAPRKRCYAHALDDETCPVNVPAYQQGFKDLLETFTAQGGAPARIFEYYQDAILFKSIIPPMPSVIQQDLEFYRATGVDTVQVLMTGDYPWTPPQINLWVFARLSWNLNQNLKQCVEEFTRTVFGVDLSSYYRTMEMVYALALDQVPEQMFLSLETTFKGIWSEPPVDVGDPVKASQDVLRRKIQKNTGLLIEKALEQIGTVKAVARADAWENERIMLELHRNWLRFDSRRVKLYEALLKGSDADIRRYILKARKSLRKVNHWGDVNIPDWRYRLNFKFLHLFYWQLRLDKIEAENLCFLPFGWLLRLWGLARALILMLRLRGLYK